MRDELQQLYTQAVNWLFP